MPRYGVVLDACVLVPIALAERFTEMREAFDDALVTGWRELEAGYQRVFWPHGPLFGLTMVRGLGGVVRITPRPGRGFSISRRRDGPTMMPWAAAVVLLVVPIAIADFDYRYPQPAVPFACLAAGLAFAPPAVRPGPAAPQPSGSEAVPGAGDAGSPPR
jgi:hypothetical protein